MLRVILRIASRNTFLQTLDCKNEGLAGEYSDKIKKYAHSKQNFYDKPLVVVKNQ